MRHASILVGLLAALGAPAMAQVCAPAGATIAYPVTKKVNQQDNYHGTTIADPYRWLEDANSADTKEWVDAQNKVTQAYLGQIPERENIRQRLTKLWNYERYTVPYKEGGRYFYTRNDGLQPQSVLYTMKNLGDTPRVLLDPNTLAADGTVALAGAAVSPDGKLLAYGTAASGSDWNEWKVRDIETGKDLADHLKWVKFSATAWTKDGKGFFYSRYDEPQEATKLADVNYFQKLYYHKIGTPQSADTLVYDRPDQKEWGFRAEVTDDGKYLLITATKGTAPKYRVFYKDLARADSKVVALVDEFEASYDFIDNDGPVMYFATDKNAPRKRIVAIDVRKPAEANWKQVVPESKETLMGASLLNNQLVTEYLADARSMVKVYDLKGKVVREIALPGIGSVSGFNGKRKDSETFYSFTGFTNPTTIYRLDLKNGKSTVFRQPKVDFDPSQYETRQQFYTSRDGTKVPMFIVSRKGLKMDGSNPTYLYGYGGFNISLTPAFSPANLAWMEMGGVYVVANLRGGGEYGEQWHAAGTKLQKQNVFDDFIAAGEYLIASGITPKDGLAIQGGSNGGLLVGAVVNQRPDLFAAANPAVGVMDMLRFDRFTAGRYWVDDYGYPGKQADFATLLAYSPYHNIRPEVRYPAVLVTTADTDDRVVPGHSFKYVAALQQADPAGEPHLIRIETRAGHGSGKPTDKIIEEAADVTAFFARFTGLEIR